MENPIYKLERVVHDRSEEMQDFEGPLDLILFLLGKNKMEIQDISISLILEQYLGWLEKRQKMDLEVASEFVTMAAHLVYIKTRMLLSIDDEEAASEMELLMAALEQHQHHESYLKIKAVSTTLGRRYEYGKDYLTKQPEPIKVKKSYQYVHEAGDLLAAMKATLERVDNKMPPPVHAFEGIVGREPYPVEDKARSILDRLIQFGVTRFRALFKSNRSRSEIVATFLAILELCRANRIHLAGTAEDCTVTSTGENVGEELNVTAEMNE